MKLRPSPRPHQVVGLPIATYSWAAALLGGRPFHTCSPGGAPDPDRAPGTPSWLEPGPAVEDTLEHLRRADPQSPFAAEQAPVCAECFRVASGF